MLVSRLHIMYNKAMSIFPQWMAGAALAFGAPLECWVTRECGAFCVGSGELSAQSWAIIRSTVVRESDAHDKPWLKVYVRLLAVGRITRWLGSVLPVL